MTHNNATWRSKRQTKKFAAKKSYVQPGRKKITVDITFAQFQRYLELLKLTNSQFRLKAAEADRESDDSGLDEDTSGDEKERSVLSARSSQHSTTKSQHSTTKSQHSMTKPQVVVTSPQRSRVQSRHLPGPGAARTGRVGPETVKSPHDEPDHARVSGIHAAAKGGTFERKLSKNVGVRKDATVVDSSRTYKRNSSVYCGKTPQTFTETPRKPSFLAGITETPTISRKPSFLAGNHPATRQFQTQRVDASAKIRLTRLDSITNSTYDIEGYDDFRCLKGGEPMYRRPTNASFPPLFRDTTFRSRRDTQDTGILLTTSTLLRTRKTNVRFSDATSVSMFSQAHCRRPSRWAAGNMYSRSSSSTASARMSVPGDPVRGRVKQSIGRCPKTESVRWLFTTQPTPLRLYVSYYEPPAEKFVDGITANDGTPLLPVSRQHILRGMVYNRFTKSIHPPLPKSTQPPNSMRRGVNLVRNVGRSGRESRASLCPKIVPRLSVADERSSQSRFKRASASVKVLGRMK